VRWERTNGSVCREILLKLALNTITLTLKSRMWNNKVKIGTTPQKTECLISIPDEGYSRDVHTKLNIYIFSIL
jgi:hypothetical protein